MDRETAITRALGAFWHEIETIYPRTFYPGISAETFNRLREAADAAVCERIGANRANGELEQAIKSMLNAVNAQYPQGWPEAVESFVGPATRYLS